MRKFFTALVVIPLGLVFIVFAVANRHLVTVSFDPFNSVDPSLAVTLPKEAVEVRETKPENITLSVDAGGRIYWNDLRIGFTEPAAAASGARWSRDLRGRRARQAGRDVVEPAP